MALSRIWSAFIMVSVFVALFKWIFSGDEKIFSRMVTGRADDPVDTIRYSLYGSETDGPDNSKSKYLSGFGYVPADSLHPASVLIALDASSIDSLRAQSPEKKVYSFHALQYRLIRPTDGLIETCKTAVTISLGLIGLLALFMGFLNIAEKAGGIRFLSRIVGPFFSKLFPELPKDHPAMGHMIMNFSANLLNLDNAATPFAIKAMESLQELNPNKHTASNAQIMFLCLHASGLTLVPVTIIALRAAAKSQTPTDIFIPCLIVTFVATLAALSIVSIRQRINIFQPVVLGWIAGISAIIIALVLYIRSLPLDRIQLVSGMMSNGLLLAVLLLIVLGGVYKRINLFDAFIEGAKGGFETAVRIIPYLVGLLVAISLLRTSGVFDVIIVGLKDLFLSLGVDTKFVDALPTALIRPLSGAGGRGMMVDTMRIFGPDSFAGRLASMFQSASDTTFYVVAVYFGAVNIRHTRYAIGGMLLADLVGVITAVFLAYLFFK